MNYTKLPIQFSDSRGFIRDIFGSGAPDSVTFIMSNAGTIRGNHVHRESTQHVYMCSGMMFAYSLTHSDINPDVRVERVELKPGDLLKHSPGEEHAYEAIVDCTFLAFADGVRKGEHYEDDTIRVPSLIDRWHAENDRRSGPIGDRC